MAADPFLQKYEPGKAIGSGSFGDVIYVRLKGSSKFLAAKFLDPTAWKHGSQSQELRILQSLDHECVVRLIDSFKPYLPASSRQRHDPPQPNVHRERPESVFVFPAFDMDLKWLIRLRTACPEEFTQEHRTSILKDVFSGLAYLHGLGVLHRDIKPANIFVRYGKRLRAVIGDVGLGKKMLSSLAAEGLHTACVCTDGYVAPELLVLRGNGKKTAVYGASVDIWAAGVVAFEVAMMSPFLVPGAMTLEGIAGRIGPSPPDYGSVGVVGAGGLEDILSGHWLEVGLMCLVWQPERRATAAVLSSHSALESGPRSDAVAVCEKPSRVSSFCTASSSAATCVPYSESLSVSGHYPSFMDSSVDLGTMPVGADPSLDLHGRPCECSGNCGNSGHKRFKCNAVATAAGHYCGQCSCKWLSCLKPASWGGFCCSHTKLSKKMSPTWKTVRAARRLNQKLVPCDVPSFMGYYERHRVCLPSVAVAAFVKEPAALDSVEAHAHRSGMDLHFESEFRECWVDVIGKIEGDSPQRPVELQQLTRNGAGRVSGYGPTMSAIGILEPSPDASVGDVMLGITRRPYNFVADSSRFHDFWKDFSDESWAAAVDAPSFSIFCVKVRIMLQEIAKRSTVFGLASEGYCFHFLYRKILIGEARFRERSTSFAAVDWQALTVGDLKYMSADSNDHLSEFDSSLSAGEVSYFIFGRVDWPLLLSCFACLWYESYESDGDQSVLAGSHSLYLFATAWWHRNGIAPHPTVLLADYRESLSPKATRKSKKRAAAEMSTSEI